MKRMMLMIGLMACFFVVTAQAMAATETIEKTFTIASGENNGSAVVSMPNSNIKEVILVCPTLDSGDTATADLTISLPGSTAASQPTATTTITPHGWAQKEIGATDDGKTFYCTAATTNIFVPATVNFTVTTSSEQAAARTFKVLFIREY